MPEPMDRGYYPPHTSMRGSAWYQLAGSGCSAAPQVPHGFEALEEALPCFCQVATEVHQVFAAKVRQEVAGTEGKH